MIELIFVGGIRYRKTQKSQPQFKAKVALVQWRCVKTKRFPELISDFDVRASRISQRQKELLDNACTVVTLFKLAFYAFLVEVIYCSS